MDASSNHYPGGDQRSSGAGGRVHHPGSSNASCHPPYYVGPLGCCPEALIQFYPGVFVCSRCGQPVASYLMVPGHSLPTWGATLRSPASNGQIFDNRGTANPSQSHQRYRSSNESLQSLTVTQRVQFLSPNSAHQSENPYGPANAAAPYPSSVGRYLSNPQEPWSSLNTRNQNGNSHNQVGQGFYPSDRAPINNYPAASHPVPHSGHNPHYSYYQGVGAQTTSGMPSTTEQRRLPRRGTSNSTHALFHDGFEHYQGMAQQHDTLGQQHQAADISAEGSTESGSGSYQCDMCGTHFTGEYAKGNMSRHKRQKHGTAEQQFPCEGCHRVFKRKDARLKHVRKYHRNLSPGPALLRK